MFGLDYSANQKRAILVIIAIAAVAMSVIFARNSTSSDGIILREPGNGSQAGVIATDSDPLGRSPGATGEVMVHVAGAVRNPNVYKLPAGKRVIDAIAAAGGATPDANIQSLNLAAKLEDGSRIDVPSINPQAVPGMATTALPNSTSSSATASSADKLHSPADGTVSLNSATLEQLQRLPGVGPSTAQKILDYRQQIGRFSSVEQLMDVNGIGPKKLEKMREFITL